MKLETIIQKQDEGLSMMRVLLGATRGIGGNDGRHIAQTGRSPWRGKVQKENGKFFYMFPYATLLNGFKNVSLLVMFISILYIKLYLH